MEDIKSKFSSGGCNNCSNQSYDANCTVLGTQEAKQAYYMEDNKKYMSELLKKLDGTETGAFFEYISCSVNDICGLEVTSDFMNSQCIAQESMERFFYYTRDGQAFMMEVTTSIDGTVLYRLFKQMEIDEIPLPIRAFNDVLVGEITVLPSSVPSQSEAMAASSR